MLVIVFLSVAFGAILGNDIQRGRLVKIVGRYLPTNKKDPPTSSLTK